MSISEKTILWLEDDPDTVRWEKQQIEEKGYNIEFRYMPHDVRNFLTLHSNNVVAIIVDVMLSGVKNLDSIGKPDISTDYGLEAGWRLIDHFLRSEDSPSNYKQIPILILSTKKQDEGYQAYLKRLQQREGGKLSYIQKNGLNARRDFTTWLNELSILNLSEKVTT
ncbi:MAG: hypothetical protein R3E08_13440 [Thiotrichaceae bacterium]